MSEPIFFRTTRPLSLADVLTLTGGRVRGEADAALRICRVVPLEEARAGDLSFFSHPRHRAALAATRASACFVWPRHAALVPHSTVAIETDDPQRAVATVLAALFPASIHPDSLFGATGLAPGANVHPDARLEDEVAVDPGAIIGPRAEIGTGTKIGPNAVIGPDVRIGRHCVIGPHASVLYALIGDRVILHAGVKIGQDGFGFVLGEKSHAKLPQIGRVIIQDDVEIGANTAIDRGALVDTVELKASSTSAIDELLPAISRQLQAYVEIPIQEDPAELIGVIRRRGAGCGAPSRRLQYRPGLPRRRRQACERRQLDAAARALPGAPSCQAINSA